MVPHIVLLLIMTTFRQYAIAEKVNTRIYNSTVNVTCSSSVVPSEVYGPLSLPACAVICTQSVKLCVGFSYFDSRCELCYVCQQSANLSSAQSLSSSYNFYLEARAGTNTCVGDPSVTTSPGLTDQPPQGMQRTVIFIQAETDPGQELFYRGGISHNQRPGCNTNAATSACAISIQHNTLGSAAYYEKMNAWSVGDNKLDWYGVESGQGSFNGQSAAGTPAAWTSNQQGNPGYQPLNTFGDHYWMVDLNMDCDATENGWFEMKLFITNSGWEGVMSQVSSCGGTAGGAKPSYTSGNHFGRCGFINVFNFRSGNCTINDF